MRRLTGILLLALMLNACGDQGRQAEGPPRIALIMKSLANEFFVTMADGAEAHQREHADQYTLIVNGIKDENDLSRQVALVEQMISIGVDAIVLAPADSRALIPVAKRAMESGVVVVNIDNKLDAEVMAESGVEIPFVGPDNREGARAIGEVVAERISEGDQVAIIEGIPTAFNSRQRKRGFEDAMQAAGAKIVSVQSGRWEQAPAHTVASAVVSEYPQLKAILCANDNMALGAAAAIQQAGREGEVMVVGFDNISAIRQMIMDGRVLATADQHGDRLAVYGIEYALRILEEDIAPADRKTPVDLVTNETLSAEM